MHRYIKYTYIYIKQIYSKPSQKWDIYWSQLCASTVPWLIARATKQTSILEGGPLPVVSRVITPFIGVITCYNHIYQLLRLFIRLISPFKTDRGPPCMLQSPKFHQKTCGNLAESTPWKFNNIELPVEIYPPTRTPDRLPTNIFSRAMLVFRGCSSSKSRCHFTYLVWKSLNPYRFCQQQNINNHTYPS